MLTNTNPAPRVKVGDVVELRCYTAKAWTVVRFCRVEGTKMVELQESAARVNTTAGEINWAWPIAVLVPSVFWKNVVAINGQPFTFPVTK